MSGRLAAHAGLCPFGDPSLSSPLWPHPAPETLPLNGATPGKAPAKTDFLEPDILADPYPHYARLRASRVETVRRGGWLRLFSYQDVDAALSDRRLSVAKIATHQDRMFRAILPSGCPEALSLFAPSTDLRSAMLLYSDPPDHTRIRTLIQPFFTPRALARLQPRIDALVDQLLAPIITRGGGDLISELAFPLPAMITAEVIGLPPEDFPIYKSWSDATVALIGAGTVTPVHLDRINDSVADLNAYLSRLAALRRVEPRHDLLSVLLATESRGGISWNEIVATCWSMLIGGHETTTGLIGNGLLALLHDPHAMADLQRDLDLLPTAIEEFLRFDSPIQQTARIALEPLTINGIPVAKGTIVECWIGAANRDPNTFPHPDRLNLRRTPNPHLAFSHGIHFCPGHALARREAASVFARLLRGLRLSLSLGAFPTWGHSCVFRSLRALPITLS